MTAKPKDTKAVTREDVAKQQEAEQTGPPAQYGGDYGQPVATVLLDFANKADTASLKFSLRARDNEDDYALFLRALFLINQIDSGANVEFEFRERDRYGGGGGGGKKRERMVIKGDQFELKGVARIEKPNRDDAANEKNPDPNYKPKGPWFFFRAYGEQDGKEVYADDLIGNQGWVNDKSPVVNSNIFPNAGLWPVDTVKPTEEKLGKILVTVAYNQTYHSYNITAIQKVGSSPPQQTQGQTPQPPLPTNEF